MSRLYCSAGILMPEAMMHQIKFAHDSSIQGVTIFHFNALTDRDFELLQAFQKEA